MSSPTDCSPCCSSTDVPVNVPGAAGSNGVNAFTTTTANFTIPTADGVTQVTVQVVNSTWLVAGQYVVIPGLVAGEIGVFQVVSKPNSTSVILVYPAYSTNTNATDVILSGAGVAAGGSGVAITFPLPIASGGTSAITKAAAQTALGLGSDQTVQNGASLAHAIATPNPTTITTMTVAAPAAGLYLVLGRATVDYQGVTFASRVLTLQAQNTTAGTTIVSAAKNTGATTTLNFPSFDYNLPFKTVTLAAGDVVALQIGLSAAASAGTTLVSAASLAIIPLKLT